MGVDRSAKNCKFANPPLNICQCMDESGLTENCPDSGQECEKYRIFNRALENLDVKNARAQARYARISTVG